MGIGGASRRHAFGRRAAGRRDPGLRRRSAVLHGADAARREPGSARGARQRGQSGCARGPRQALAPAGPPPYRRPVAAQRRTDRGSVARGVDPLRRHRGPAAFGPARCLDLRHRHRGAGRRRTGPVPHDQAAGRQSVPARERRGHREAARTPEPRDAHRRCNAAVYLGDRAAYAGTRFALDPTTLERAIDFARGRGAHPEPGGLRAAS